MAVQIQNWAIFGICTVVLASFIALYFYMTRNFGYWKKKGVAEERPVPFFGSFLPCITFKKSANEFFKDIYAKHKGESVVGFYLFDKPALLVRDIDLINQIMVKDFHIFPNRYATPGGHDVLGSASLFFFRAPHWKTVRSKLSPTFTSGKLRNMFQLIVDVGKDLESHFDSFDIKDGGQVIELRETCASYTTDVIASCAYGLQANSLINPDAEFRKAGRKIFGFNYKRGLEVLAIFFAPGIVKPLGIMLFTKSCSEFLRNALWSTLTQRMESGVRRNDLIDTLIDLKRGQTQAEIDDPNSYKFDGDNLTAQAAIYFTAGFGTPSITLAYTLHELALNHDIQSKLREEITAGFEENGGKLSYDWINQLPYLNMVVSETLRKYSILGFIDRVADADYKVPGSDLVIEKGTPIYISVAGNHHDPEYFPDPEKYDPERFSIENKQKGPSRGYIPWGKGPRYCLGNRFALASAKLGLVKMLMKYRFTTCKDTVIPPRPNPRSNFTEMDHGLFLNVEKIATAAIF